MGVRAQITLRPISISVALAARAKRTALEHAQFELLRNIFSSPVRADRFESRMCFYFLGEAKRSEATDMEIGLKEWSHHLNLNLVILFCFSQIMLKYSFISKKRKNTCTCFVYYFCFIR